MDNLDAGALVTSAPLPEVMLIRHPKTVAPGGTIYGATDLDAHPDHLAQDAERLAPFIPTGATIISSPQRRALALAEAIGPVARTDDRLREVNFGDWEMAHWQHLPDADLDAFLADPLDYRVPGAETGRELTVRALAFWAEVPRDAGPLVIVAHGGPLRAIGAEILGLPQQNATRLDIGWGRYGVIAQRFGRDVIRGWSL